MNMMNLRTFFRNPAQLMKEFSDPEKLMKFYQDPAMQEKMRDPKFIQEMMQDPIFKALANNPGNFPFPVSFPILLSRLVLLICYSFQCQSKHLQNKHSHLQLQQIPMLIRRTVIVRFVESRMPRGALGV